jgi:hypothetical protein
MNGFLKATFTRQKFHGLFINTALGNFAGYVAGSLVTLASTRHVVERRGLSNLFGFLPRQKVVVHVLPHWLEWLLALIVGFLVMEAVRYWINHRKYTALLSGLRPERGAGQGSQTNNQLGATEQCADDEGAQEVPPTESRSVQKGP